MSKNIKPEAAAAATKAGIDYASAEFRLALATVVNELLEAGELNLEIPDDALVCKFAARIKRVEEQVQALASGKPARADAAALAKDDKGGKKPAKK